MPAGAVVRSCLVVRGMCPPGNFFKDRNSGGCPIAIQEILFRDERTFLTLKSIPVTYSSLYGRIYEEVSGIPYGTTMTYGEIGTRLGTSPRVIGQAMSRNPTPIIVPCHRVVAKDGPGGFSPSPEIKVFLLDLEKKGVKRKIIARAHPQTPAPSDDHPGVM